MQIQIPGKNLKPVGALVATFVLSMVAVPNSLADDQWEQGKKVYFAQCASCHGDHGEGNPNKYRQALAGDLSVEELAELISDTMPEEEPGTCVAADADAVANFISESFYSAEAQRRLNVARVELSHLTVRQYRQSVADVIGSFGNELWISDERGIKANYFAASNWTKDKQLAEQTDAQINFREGVPYFRADGKYEGIKQDEKRENQMGLGFSVYWNGGIVAPETGHYQITVKGKNGFRLWINDPKLPLLDRWVRSDDQLEHHASIYMLAGRVYSLRLNMFTFKDPTANIQLEWKPPHGVQTAIPPAAFLNYGTTEVAAISTVFPPDDASAGFKRGVSVSPGWDRATTTAAMEAATWISDRIWRIAKTKENAENRAEKINDFCRQFVERAFVAKLTDEEIDFFVDQHFGDSLSLTDSVKRVVILTLKSPRFLYPEIQMRDEHLQRARRLALFFWDSVPDRQLFNLARKGKLSDEGERMSEVFRLLDNPRSKQKLRSFFHQWLRMDEAAEATKDQHRFPGFDDALVSDLRTSLNLFVDDVVWNEKSDFRNLFLADHLFANKRLAAFYSLESVGENFNRVSVPTEKHSGILTHPFMMSGFAYHTESSPIHRGVFVSRNLLGRSLKQPASAVAPLTEEFDPTMTTRERVAHQTKEAACMACHSVINPLGFSLENYDAVGRFRIEDKQKPITTDSVYKTPAGEKVEFSGARDLANFIANNEAAQKNFTRQLFQHYVNQSIYAFGDNQLNQLHQHFVEGNFNIRSLLVEMANVVTENHKRSASGEESQQESWHETPLP